MKTKLLVLLSLLSLFLVGCSANDRSEESEQTFGTQVDQLTTDPDNQVDEIEVIAKNGFDWIQVRMDDSILELSEAEQLSICEAVHPQILDAYDECYVKENSGVHKPVVTYFTEGFDEVAQTNIAEGNREELLLVEE